jgi:hypothetical protein
MFAWLIESIIPAPNLDAHNNALDESTAHPST